MINKNEILRKLIVEAKKMGSNPDAYPAYEKGFVAGQIHVLRKLIDEEQIVTVVTADTEAFKVD